MHGFRVTEHEDLRADFEAQVGNWLGEGIDRVPAAFESLLNGGSTDRGIVAVTSQLR